MLSLTSRRRALFAASLCAFASVADAAPPLSNCTGPGGVLSNGNTTCTFTVSTTDDLVTGDASGYTAMAGSLRKAILDANAWGNHGNTVTGNSVINLTPGLSGQTLTIGHALPMLMSNITINGPAGGATIDGGSADFASGVRCFFVSGLPVAGSGPAANPNDGMPQAIHVRLSNLTLQNCRARGGDGSGGGLGAGGALFVNQQATVDLDRVNFNSNRAIGGTGQGGIRGGGGMGGGTVGFSGGGGIGASAGGSNGAGAGIGGSVYSGTGGGGFGLDTSDAVNPSRGVGTISVLQGFPTAESGGANGGGGGSGGFPGNGFGGGGNSAAGGGIGGAFHGGVGGGGAYAGATAAAGTGGFGGGGGGSPISTSGFSAGGDGGFGGGGGAGTYCGCSTPGIAGHGGFGGGGAFGLNGGAGGFGAGSGSTGGSPSPVAKSGFGAADPTSTGTFTPANGTAMGATIFAVNGAVINFFGNGDHRGGRLSNAVPRSATPVGNNGLLLGEGMFLQGNGTITLTQGVGETLALNDEILDQTGSANRLSDPTPFTYPSGGPFNGSDWSYSSRGSWALIKNGPGTLILGGGFSNYSGQNQNNAGTVLLQNNALGFGSWSNHARMVWGTAPFAAPPLEVGMGNALLSNSVFLQTASGVVRMRLNGPSCEPDRLSVGGEAQLGGTFWIDVRGGCVPTAGQTNWYISTNANSGQFDRVVVTGMPAGRTLAPIYDEAQFKLQEAAGASAPVLNIDDSDAASRYQAATDGLLIMRYLLGTRGAALTANTLGATPGRNAAQIEAYLAGIIHLLDVDGDGQTLATTDGVMIMRRLLGLSGSALTAGAKVGAVSDGEVEFAIDALKP